jgi:NodT family efflux transporter outer membrane factor (OMF) lipoprotein
MMMLPRLAGALTRAGAAGLSCLTATCLLAACTGLRTDASSGAETAKAWSAVDVRPEWQTPAPSGEGLIVVPAAEFWARFGDPALPALLRASQVASPTLAAAAARVERARATQVAAAAAVLPTLGATGSISQARSLGGAGAGSGTLATRSASIGLQAGWELDLFGAGSAGRNAAAARLRGAQALLVDARTALAAEVAAALISLRACEAQLLVTRQDADSRGETARLTDLTARAGFTAPADAALARAGAAQARATATQQRGSCETQVKAIVELTGLAEPAVRQELATATARLPDPPGVLPPSLPADLLQSRPDLVEAALAVQAASADRDQAAARERPQVSLSGSLGGLSLSSGGETQRGTTWSIGPLSVNFPLFDGGARAANTAAARADYDNAVAQYRAAVRRAVREVEAGLVSLQSSAERFDDARSAAADFEAALRATEARQKGGLGSLLDLEIARRNALAARSGVIELQRERAAAWVALVRALGGGWQARPADTTTPAPSKTGPTP